MADHTHIEWTDATWNPITGCSVISPGCTNCYAMKLAGTRLRDHPSRQGLTQTTKAGPVWTGDVRFNRQWLDKPLLWKRPRRIFVCAHADLFHESVPIEWIDLVFAVMALAPQHTFQVLTKRAGRMRDYLRSLTLDRLASAWPVPSDLAMSKAEAEARLIGTEAHRALYHAPAPVLPLPNVWAGISFEDQRRATERLFDLLNTPAAVRWASGEPLLEGVDLTALEINGDSELDALRPYPWASEVEQWRGTSDTWEGDFLDHYGLSELPTAGFMHPTLDWVVIGGESGARPMHPDWARKIRDDCASAGVPFLFKQWGSHAWVERVEGDPTTLTAYRASKRAAGRRLDGVLHDGYPEVRS